MIWSTNSAELRRSSEAIRAAQPPMLEQTNILAAEFAHRNIPFTTVEYFSIPPRAHDIGKLVVTFASIDSRGHLIDNLPAFYGVTARPDVGTWDSKATLRRSREAHVVAEHTSLRRGIFTPYGRTNSELLVAGMVTDAYKADYLADRMAHLEALSTEADESLKLYPRQRETLVEELGLAIDALANL